MPAKTDKKRAATRLSYYDTLSGSTPEASQYRLGNRNALEWVIDQYHVSEDKRSGIKSDRNREARFRISPVPFVNRYSRRLRCFGK